ncbi:ABC transporter permease [soil metagenome]
MTALHDQDRLDALVAQEPRTRFWRNPGGWWSLPMLVLLGLGFAGPILIVLAFSFMSAGAFDISSHLTMSNYGSITRLSFDRSYITSIRLALITTLICLLVSYPIAYALVKILRPRAANVVTALIVTPLLVSENTRLFGWNLILSKKGILDGTAQSLFSAELPTMLFNEKVIVLGMLYIYVPFMLFPLVIGLSNVPDEIIEAARDLGATRWQILREVEAPLAKPGIVIGGMLTFVLSLGAISEAQILGGNAVTPITKDIDRVFGFQQNWPFGSALSIVLVAITGVIA